MSAALCELFILLIVSVSVSGQDHLPKADECGTLNTNYYYNQKNLSEIGEFPWIGRVQYEDNGKTWFQCECALISERFVLLNARCYHLQWHGTFSNSSKVQPARILLGEWNRGNSPKKSDCDDSGRCAPVPKMYQIEESILHPKYSNETTDHNIALAKLSETVKFSDFIRPICLPSKEIVQMTFDNELLEVTGWFREDSDGSTLVKSFARVVNLNTCELKLKKSYEVDKEASICALTCWDKYVYNIGANLMGTTLVNEEPANYYLIGLIIYSNPRCSLDVPNVYSRVDRYLDWIYENTNYENSLINPRQA